MSNEKQTARHPLQPLVKDSHGHDRFKENRIVSFLAQGKLNDLSSMDFPQEDWEQFAQLIGYSLSGFGELSYVSDPVYQAAAESLEKTAPSPEVIAAKLAGYTQGWNAALAAMADHIKAMGEVLFPGNGE